MVRDWSALLLSRGARSLAARVCSIATRTTRAPTQIYRVVTVLTRAAIVLAHPQSGGLEDALISAMREKTAQLRSSLFVVRARAVSSLSNQPLRHAISAVVTPTIASRARSAPLFRTKPVMSRSGFVVRRGNQAVSRD